MGYVKKLMLFFIIYYLLGLFIGFTNTMSVYSLFEKLKIIIVLVLTIIFKEYLRYMILCKCELNKKKVLIMSKFIKRKYGL